MVEIITPRSALGRFTAETTLAWLLTGRRSVSKAPTEAELLSWPDIIVGLTTTVTLAEALARKLARLPIIRFPLVTRFPWEAIAETKVAPAGTVLVKVTPVASLGPALVIKNV